MNTAKARLGAFGLAAVLVATGCGASPTASGPGTGGGEPTAAEKFYAEMAGLKGQARRDKLVERAKQEKTLNLYTSMTSDIADSITKAFSDKFGIDVQLYRAGSETVLQRVLQEQSAKFAGNDVIETNANELFALNTERMLAEYKGERRDLVPKAGQFDGWTASRFNLFAPSWNTTLVGKGQEPKRWEDLADPKWDGKLSMEIGDYDWYLTLYGYWKTKGKSEAEIDKLFADMAKGAKIVKGHTVQGELLSAGQFSLVASNYSYIVDRAKAKGAPVDFLPFAQPVIARPNGVGLMKSAPHPAAAMLFTDWLLEEGQQVLVKDGLTPAVVTGEDPLKGVEIVPIDVKTMVEHGDEWQKKYDKVVAGGEQVSN
ncbi:ABC transporter substrate-binding protein [Kibdelosporangium aridum]|uniref:Iron(III) transport system substrate-binding protein n=1 Tax=Kibdelosporangium aridum TaxID=2030 RepID=A0A1Y5XZC3_KIBAR|nr:ABC transporter substrate-binding protein [Kibdelosporangium aridum]SMD22444.1 iron(III) transport system substrate-binding protein [Kibdelosporangium aridum]